MDTGKNYILNMTMKRTVKTVFICSCMLTLFTIYQLNSKDNDKVYSVKRINENSTTFLRSTMDGEAFNKTALELLSVKYKDNRNYSDKPRLPDGRSCPNITKHFVGKQRANKTVLSFTELERMFPDVEEGGHWAPPNCTNPKKVAIILPFRDRETHLKLLLLNLIPKLQRQMVDFTIYVVEQSEHSGFNRGMMRNIGFYEASRARKYDCYVFNDVDTLIEDDRNIYTCYPNAAFHMAVAVDRFGYELKYWDIVGGIISLTEDSYRQINGYSNFYFMWGAEDDDLRRRLKAEKIPLYRPPVNISTITTFRHLYHENIYRRYIIFKKIGVYFKKDGVNSLKYETLALEKKKLYTRIHVKVDEHFYNKMLRELRH